MNSQIAEPKLPVGLTVLIADDHSLVRDGLRTVLSSLLRDVNMPEAADGYELSKLMQQHPVHLALVDLNMPGMARGFRLSELARLHPQVPLVVISALTSPDVVRRTLKIATVHAFVSKSAPSVRLCAAIEAALRGQKQPYAQDVTPPRRTEAALTPRMEEVRRLLRQGMTNKVIAAMMGISEGTVKNHISEIFRALQVSNRTQAAQLDSEVI